MRKSPAVALLLLLSLLSACGGGDDRTGSTTNKATDEASSKVTQFRLLSQEELDDLTLSVQDMPEGWSKDPDETPRQKVCGWKAAKDSLAAGADFLKGGGFDQEAAGVAIRQYESPKAARADFDAFVKAVEGCGKEDGVTYSVTSAPDVGEDNFGATGVDGETNATGTQYIALVGPTIVASSVAGLMSVDTDSLTPRLKEQVGRYRDAATK